MEASANTGSAQFQSPLPTAASSAVATTPSNVNRPSQRLRCPRRSASAPSQGASSITTRLAAELVMPRYRVERVPGRSAAQYLLRKTGKKPTRTVVTKP